MKELVINIDEGLRHELTNHLMRASSSAIVPLATADLRGPIIPYGTQHHTQSALIAVGKYHFPYNTQSGASTSRL
jgi:hypothetical protein